MPCMMLRMLEASLIWRAAFACLAQGGQQDADEQRDDRDDHQQLNQRERPKRVDSHARWASMGATVLEGSVKAAAI